MPAKFPLLLRVVLLAGVACSLNGQFLFGPKRGTPKPAAPKAVASRPMRKASELISRQEPVKINNSLIKQITPENVHVVISLPKQRAYLMMGDEIVIDSPISSGKRGHSSPTGNFSVMEKDPVCGMQVDPSKAAATSSKSA